MTNGESSKIIDYKLRLMQSQFYMNIIFPINNLYYYKDRSLNCIHIPSSFKGGGGGWGCLTTPILVYDYTGIPLGNFLIDVCMLCI